jgi:hypothetical protein
MRIRIRDPESIGLWIWNPGWKSLDPESGINITDPQHCSDTIPLSNFLKVLVFSLCTVPYRIFLCVLSLSPFLSSLSQIILLTLR